MGSRKTLFQRLFASIQHCFGTQIISKLIRKASETLENVREITFWAETDGFIVLVVWFSLKIPIRIKNLFLEMGNETKIRKSTWDFSKSTSDLQIDQTTENLSKSERPASSELRERSNWSSFFFCTKKKTNPGRQWLSPLRNRILGVPKTPKISACGGLSPLTEPFWLIFSGIWPFSP